MPFGGQLIISALLFGRQIPMRVEVMRVARDGQQMPRPISLWQFRGCRCCWRGRRRLAKLELVAWSGGKRHGWLISFEKNGRNVGSNVWRGVSLFRFRPGGFAFRG